VITAVVLMMVLGAAAPAAVADPAIRVADRHMHGSAFTPALDAVIEGGHHLEKGPITHRCGAEDSWSLNRPRPAIVNKGKIGPGLSAANMPHHQRGDHWGVC
jgi:hypothetical protein